MSDSVAAEFSLNTQMLLISKKTLWLSDGSMGFGQESDTAFSEGIKVHNITSTSSLLNPGLKSWVFIFFNAKKKREGI